MDEMQEVNLHESRKNNPEWQNQEQVSRGAAVAASWVYFRDFIHSRKFRSNVRLFGKTVIITGGNTGIGKQTALDLCRREAKVIIACRDMDKATEAINDIRQTVPNANIVAKALDLASLASVREFAKTVLETEPHINILINNAGVAGCPKSSTKDGFEMQFGVNHLGHFLLTLLLLDRVKESAPSRIVNVASLAHAFGKLDLDDLNLDRGYNPLLAYCRSKLANILFTRELAKRLRGSGVTTYCLHPGAVHTGLGRHLGASINSCTGRLYHAFSRLLWKSPKKGAQTVLYCALEESIAQKSGLYYCDCTVVQPAAKARDDAMAQKLWELSEMLVSINQ